MKLGEILLIRIAHNYYKSLFKLFRHRKVKDRKISPGHTWLSEDNLCKKSLALLKAWERIDLYAMICTSFSRVDKKYLSSEL